MSVIINMNESKLKCKGWPKLKWPWTEKVKFRVTQKGYRLSRGETLLKILGAKWAPKFLNLGAHFNFQGPTSFEYRFAKKNNKMKNAGFAFLC